MMPMLRLQIRDADPSPEAVRVSSRAARAVTQITSGLTSLLRALEEAEQRVRAYESPEERLTPRERDVLRLLTEGQTNTEIGRRLFISIHTVRGHTRSILRKLGLRSRQEAADWARRVEPSPVGLPKNSPLPGREPEGRAGITEAERPHHPGGEAR
jgi:DNA-binding NarL/FixJ family response regulator